ncbi:MAG TPA: hypothetical protein VI479_07015, partial [Blastocatellia bacterium]
RAIMTKKKSSEFIEQAAPTEQADQIEQAAGRVFDFTGPVETLGEEEKSVYYRLCRVAILAGDEDQLPDKKVYTEAKVIEILGEDYATGLVIDKKCCG